MTEKPVAESFDDSSAFNDVLFVRAKDIADIAQFPRRSESQDHRFVVDFVVPPEVVPFEFQIHANEGLSEFLLLFRILEELKIGRRDIFVKKLQAGQNLIEFSVHLQVVLDDFDALLDSQILNLGRPVQFRQ